MGQIYTREDLEEFGDKVKSGVLVTLVNEGYLEPHVADRWGLTHTVVLKKYRVFRSLLSKWFKLHEAEDVEKNSWHVLVMENTSTDIEGVMDDLHAKDTGGQQQLDLQNK